MTTTPARILVVDDEESILQFVSYNLRKEGYDVTTAPDGDTALELAAEAVRKPWEPRADEQPAEPAAESERQSPAQKRHRGALPAS